MKLKLVNIGYEPNHNRQTTYFLDIDGCLLHHKGGFSTMMDEEPEVLPGVLDKLNEWKEAGDMVIITSARPEMTRAITMAQLHHVGIFYKVHYRDLLMEIHAGKRIVVNDAKPDMPETAGHVILERNSGFENFPS